MTKKNEGESPEIIPDEALEGVAGGIDGGLPTRYSAIAGPTIEDVVSDIIRNQTEILKKAAANYRA